MAKFKLKTPVIVVNFKTYEESTNNNAVKLAQICEKVSKKTKKNIIICVDAIDLKSVASKVKIPVFAQHVDGFDYGSHTGKILPEVVKLAGGVGTIINHSEDRYTLKQIKEAIDDCKKEKIISLVCAQDDKIAGKIAKLKPDMIAVEPPKLIGGDISVTSANPKIVSDSVNKVKKIARIPVLCGAGVKNKDDVKMSIKLGAKGVLLASGVVKAADPKKVLEDLCKGM